MCVCPCARASVGAAAVIPAAVRGSYAQEKSGDGLFCGAEARPAAWTGSSHPPTSPVNSSHTIKTQINRAVPPHAAAEPGPDAPEPAAAPGGGFLRNEIHV